MKVKDSTGFYLSVAGFVLAILTVLAAMAAGLGSRWEWWHFRTGFTILRWAANGGLVAAALAIAGFIIPRPRLQRGKLILSIIGLVLGLSVVGVLGSWWHAARSVPAIHDITTDTENPPRFVSILPVRKGAPNGTAYGGPEIAAQQRQAYPDVTPAMLSLPPPQAFLKALQAAKDMGWGIVDSHQGEGRIEATDTTFWFGFKDDIVIRVTPTEKGSRVDIRSVSRVGRSDLGTNAKRIRKYLKLLTEKP